ncbi:MAG TPA: 3'-5' exoribonuclease YhaM family protein [Candidatus Coprocola pullicola]|nr:3'-5' exoribonuclease YhaM family protein [Candidatus Coprocola pullicola]
MRYIKELREGENVVEHYLCKSKQSLKSRAGKTYLSLKLQDKTGTVDAKVWDMTNDIKAFEENEFIKIDATVVTYQNDIQLNVKRIRRSLEGEYDPADYIPCTEKNMEQMYRKLMGYIKTIESPYIKKLLEEIFYHHPIISKCFKTHSAAKSVHHSYMGGLLEHTLSVTEICDFAAPRYKFVDRDILIASAMLHDVGKVMELSQFPENDYTDEGQLLGHLIIGSELIGQTAAKIEGFPKPLENLLKHCMLSHHGEYEYGSPKLPKTIEAFILHSADNLDAKTKVIEEMIENSSNQGSWAGYQKMLQRNIRKSDY